MRAPRLRPSAWIARVMLPTADAKRLLADLDDEHQQFQRRQRSRARAALWYWHQVVHSIWILRRRDAIDYDTVRSPGTPPATSPTQRGGKGLEPMDALLRDIRYAIRKLIAAPTFTATCVLTLGLGIGATAAIFSVVDAVLLTDLPYAEPHRIIRAWAHADDGDIVDFSFRVVEYRELALRTGTFDAVGGEFPISFTALIPEQEPRQIDGRMVTSDFFRVFGAGPDLGRMFDAEEIAAGDALVADANDLDIRAGCVVFH